MFLDSIQNENALYIGAQDNGTCRTLTGGVEGPVLFTEPDSLGTDVWTK